MTYQLALKAKDGMILASDQRELLLSTSVDMGSGPKTNLLRKIQTDSTRRFAWAYAGSKVSPVAARYIQKTFTEVTIENEQRIEAILIASGDESWVVADGPQSESTILFVDGAQKSIRRAKLLPHGMTTVDLMQGGSCIAGMNHSIAGLLVKIGYSETLTVDCLVALAACVLKLAEDIDPLCIAGADIAAYRDATGRFEFIAANDIATEGSRLENEIREAIQSVPR